MARVQADVVASWNAPPWAASSDADEEAVIHSRRVGGLLDLDGGDVSVEVVQRDELCLRTGSAAFVRGPACLTVGGVRLSLDNSLYLAWLLISARQMAQVTERAAIDPRRELGSPPLPSVSWSWLHALAKENMRDGL